MGPSDPSSTLSVIQESLLIFLSVCFKYRNEDLKSRGVHTRMQHEAIWNLVCVHNFAGTNPLKMYSLVHWWSTFARPALAL